MIIPDVRGLYPFSHRAGRALRGGRPSRDRLRLLRADRRSRPARRRVRLYGPHREQVKLDQALDDCSPPRRRSSASERGGGPPVTVGFCFGGSPSFIAGASPDLDLAGWSVSMASSTPPDSTGRGVLTRGRRHRRTSSARLFGGADKAISHRSRSTSSSRRCRPPGSSARSTSTPVLPHSFFDRKQQEFAEESEDAWRRILGFLARTRERVAPPVSCLRRLRSWTERRWRSGGGSPGVARQDRWKIACLQTLLSIVSRDELDAA